MNPTVTRCCSTEPLAAGPCWCSPCTSRCRGNLSQALVEADMDTRWISSICTLPRTEQLPSAREYANRRDPARYPCQLLPKPVTDCHDSETCTVCTNMVQLQVAPSSSNGFLPEARSNERSPIPHHPTQHKPERERICSTRAIGGLKKHAHGFSKPTVRESVESVSYTHLTLPTTILV